jgi:hypothetical protein
VLGGVIIGFICALILHDNKIVAFLAHFISSKRARVTDASSLYDKDNIPRISLYFIFILSLFIIHFLQVIHILLNINLNTMWFNVGYWKNINPTSNNDLQMNNNPFVCACQEMTSLLTSAVGMEDGCTILGMTKNILYKNNKKINK